MCSKEFRGAQQTQNAIKCFKMLISGGVCVVSMCDQAAYLSVHYSTLQTHIASIRHHHVGSSENCFTNKIYGVEMF